MPNAASDNTHTSTAMHCCSTGRCASTRCFRAMTHCHFCSRDTRVLLGKSVGHRSHREGIKHPMVAGVYQEPQEPAA